MKQILSAPAAINLEITDGCNFKCKHCYNFWREEGTKFFSVTRDRMDQFIDLFVDAGIFHVVLTGGEPFVNFEILEYGIKKFIDNNITVSCNSNLALATKDKIKALADAGLDHILTSLNSYDPETNDSMVNRKGAFKKITTGIETTVNNGIRVSVNMIISQTNKDHVYRTGKLCADLGCQKIFGTRIVPPVNTPNLKGSTHYFTRAETLKTLDDMVQAKKDTGIMIGTLVSYPLCLLGDLGKYRDFVGRGCPAQRGRVIGINAGGDTHACVHESKSYGNIFKIGLKNAYKNMRPWHDNSYRYQGCEGCYYIDVCETGCRMSARSYFGHLGQQDNLMINKNSFSHHYKIVYDKNFYAHLEKGIKFTAPSRLRFRAEDGFYIVSIRWANTILLDQDVGDFLIQKQKTGEEFSLDEFGKDKKDVLAKLFFKDVIESRDVKYDDLKSKDGLSIELSGLPE